MKKTLSLFIFILLTLSSCSSPSQEPLKISATTWVGYTPLYYAKEKGWLKEINVKLINVVSLSENMYLYKAGSSDAYCGTQYEHSILKKRIPNLIPIILFDRSNGGDIIMSNSSIKEIQGSREKIDAYLEMDSINFSLLNDFIVKYKIDESRINYINRDQISISALKNDTPDRLRLIVTYIPYNTPLGENGFKEILSTKNGLDLLVVDALYTTKETLILHKKQFSQLKALMDKAILALHQDPKEFYMTIQFYMNGLSYEEFSNGLHDIEWINTNLTKDLSERMHKASFPTKDLL